MTNDLIREPAPYLGSAWVAGGGSDGDDEVENPATEELTAIVTQASASDVDDAVGAARGAFDGWASTPVPDRVDALRRLHDVITERADTFATPITREQGSPPPVARKLHVDTPLDALITLGAPGATG